MSDERVISIFGFLRGNTRQLTVVKYIDGILLIVCHQFFSWQTFLCSIFITNIKDPLKLILIIIHGALDGI